MNPKDFEGKWAEKKTDSSNRYWYIIKVVKVSEKDFAVDLIYIRPKAANANAPIVVSVGTKHLWDTNQFENIVEIEVKGKGLMQKAIEGIFK